MTAAALLQSLRAKGVSLWAEGDRIRFRAPVGALAEPDKEALRERREAVLALLSPVPKCSLCGRTKAQIRGRAPRCLVCDGAFQPEGPTP